MVKKNVTKRKRKRKKKKKDNLFQKLLSLLKPYQYLFSFNYGGITIGVLIVIIIGFTSIIKNCNTEKNLKKIPAKEREFYKKNKPKNTYYRAIVEEKKYENLNMIGYVSKTGVHGNKFEQRLYGMTLRALRFQNITEKVEKKYGLDRNLLLSMIMQESGGADLLPNSSDDGGLGLCHMQPLLADMFGLKTYDNCKKLRSKSHGKKLRELIIEHDYNRRELIKYDDRFHPLLNIDAAGRMLAYYMSGLPQKNTPLKTAIVGYAGKTNYKKYYKNVVFYMKKLNDDSFINKVRKEFNRLNPDLRIAGKKADFDDYIKTHQELNRNYGLDDYK